MSKAPFLPLATDAFIADTTGLNASETGAYMMLLICQWRNNGLPLENSPKKLQRMTRCTKVQFNRVWPEISHFFEITKTTITQKRVEKDFLEVLKKIAVKSVSGKCGGRPKSLETNDTDKANGYDSLKLNESETKATINHNHNQDNTNVLLREGSDKYKFQGKIIRLTIEDYNRWKKTYSAIPDLDAALQSADDWIRGETAEKQKRWFNMISGMLSNKHNKYLKEVSEDDQGTVGNRPKNYGML
tara:strand:- start:439 stop:1170 length:732 start_codon:yes stop_codon:yes gene_type:complete